MVEFNVAVFVVVRVNGVIFLCRFISVLNFSVDSDFESVGVDSRLIKDFVNFLVGFATISITSGACSNV